MEGRIANLGPDLVAALDPEAGPGLEAAPGPVAGPGLRTGPNPETVLGPEVARSRLIEKIRRLEETKEGPGLRVGPSLALNLEAGPRIGPNPGTVLNPNQDLVLNPGMIKKKHRITKTLKKKKEFAKTKQRNHRRKRFLKRNPTC